MKSSSYNHTVGRKFLEVILWVVVSFVLTAISWTTKSEVASILVIAWIVGGLFYITRN